MPSKSHRVDCQCLAKSLVNDPPCDCRSWSKRLSCSTSGKFQGIRKRTVTFNSLTILSSWLRRSCRRSSEQYRSCSVLSRLGNRRCTGSRNWNVWIGGLDSRLAPGDGGRKRPASAVGSGNSDRGAKTWRLRKEILVEHATQPFRQALYRVATRRSFCSDIK